jgi:hypothetical protein
MTKGDLCHIPQGTILLNMEATRWLKPEKPITAVFLKDMHPNCVVHVAGKSWCVKKRDIYPIKEKEDGETNTSHLRAV